MSSRISSIAFDKRERPKRATIITKLGTIKVEWMELHRDRCWFTSGVPDEKRPAVPAIERIERLVRDL